MHLIKILFKINKEKIKLINSFRKDSNFKFNEENSFF